MMARPPMGGQQMQGQQMQGQQMQGQQFGGMQGGMAPSSLGGHTLESRMAMGEPLTQRVVSSPLRGTDLNARDAAASHAASLCRGGSALYEPHRAMYAVVVVVAAAAIVEVHQLERSSAEPPPAVHAERTPLDPKGARRLGKEGKRGRLPCRHWAPAAIDHMPTVALAAVLTGTVAFVLRAAELRKARETACRRVVGAY